MLFSSASRPPLNQASPQIMPPPFSLDWLLAADPLTPAATTAANTPTKLNQVLLIE